MKMYEQVERNIMPNGWRNTKYKRTDGTAFYVALPRITYTVHGEIMQYGYDEQAELEMADKLMIDSLNRDDTIFMR